MAISLESLQKHKAKLAQDHDQLMANLNATKGALEMLEILIKEESQPSPPCEPQPESPPSAPSP